MIASKAIQDDISLVASLKVCAKQKDLSKGNKIHADVLQTGLLGRNVFVDTAIINVYAKCGALCKAQLVFDEIPVHNLATWNALIAGFAHYENGDDAFSCYQKMQDEGFSPSPVTYACILKACHSIEALKVGIGVHAEIARQGLIRKNQVLGNALIALYAKYGILSRACEIFNTLPARNIVSWTALITGYCENGQSAEAVRYFEQMKREGLTPDAVTFASILKAYGDLGASEKGQRIHTEIIREGWLGRARMLGNAVVDMYAKCGLLVKAQEIFHKLPNRDVVSWTSLIAGYARMGYYINIFDLFNRMLRDGVHPNTITFTLLLNSCSCLSLVDARQTYFETVSKDYGTIFRFGHQRNTIGFHGFEERVTMVKEAVGKLLSLSSPLLLSLLVDTFKRIAVLPFQHVISRDESFCAVSESQEDAVLSELKKTERKQWTNFSSGHDKGSAFMSLSPQPLLVMHNKDGNPPRNPGELLVCQSQHFNEEGIIKRSSEYRIPGYGHDEINGSIMASGESVKELPPLNELTFCNGNYQELQQEMVLRALIKACTCERDLPKGSRLHANILKSGLLKNIIISNALLNMYVKCGAFIKARHIFAELANRNVVSWTTLIAGYCEHGHDEEARKCFDQMKLEGLIPDAVTLGCILKAFGSREMMPKGQEIHVEAVRGGLLEQRTLIGNALVHMYAKCGALGRAQEVFNKLLVQDVASWTALITGYSEHGQGHEALHYFEQMKLTGLSPNAVTYISILKACGTLENVEKGKEIHAEILREGLLEKKNVLNTGLVHMYAKCGMLQKAQGMFDELPDQNVVSWNTLIAGYCHYGQIDKAFDCFKNMKQMGVSPDSVTFTCLLKACGSKRSVRKGDELYKEIFHRGLLQNSVLLGNAVVDMYTKGGELAKAQQVFEELPNHSLASWTSLIAGYCQSGHCEEALNYFEQMKNEGFSPDVVTFACALKACGTSGAIEKGEEIYLEIVREGLLEKFSALGNALVNMYAKCGAVVKAQEVFNKLPAHDIISWTALITGYCEHGHCEKAFSCFELMKFEGFSPDTVTLSVILKACSNIGAADTSLGYLEMVSSDFGLVPTSQQYGSVVDVLSQGGQFDKAMTVIRDMPYSDCLSVWFALLGACQKWGNVKLAKQAFDHALHIDQGSAIAFVCMSNIYASVAMQVM